jgi:hypothetical protein
MDAFSLNLSNMWAERRRRAFEGEIGSGSSLAVACRALEVARMAIEGRLPVASVVELSNGLESHRGPRVGR